MKKTQCRLESIDKGIHQSRQLLLEFEKVQTNNSAVKPTIKMDIEDVRDEISYWESSVICYVIGVNHPFLVMEGYLHRI